MKSQNNNEYPAPNFDVVNIMTDAAYTLHYFSKHLISFIICIEVYFFLSLGYLWFCKYLYVWI